MRKKRGSAALSVAVSAVLAVSLCPVLALADEPASEGGLSASAGQLAEGDELGEGELAVEGVSESAGEGEAASATEPAAASVAAPLSLGATPAAASTGAIVPDYSWYSDSATEFSIGTVAELFGFANIANGTDGKTLDSFAGKIIKLANDIDLGGATWTPVGSESNQFKGTFDGQGHTVKNFELGCTTDSDGYQYYGFFTWISWGTNIGNVNNLTLQGITATIGSKGRFGAVACYAGGGNDKDYTDNMTHDVHVKDVTVTSTSADARVGGMFCRTSRSFKDCSVQNVTVNAPNGAVTIGGFTSFVYANNQHFQNCSVDGFKVSAANCDNGDGIGGFAGHFNNSYGWTNFFENCKVANYDVTVGGTKAWVGGFVGSPCSNLIGTNCSAQGRIDASGVTGGFVGGFMGNFGWKAANGAVYSVVHQLENCTADVDVISGGASAGGFVGSATCNINDSTCGSKYGVFKNCAASGDVANIEGVAGGFAGDAISGRYSGCSATGNVTGKIAGGFIGEARDYTPSWDNVYFNTIGNANEIALDTCGASGVVLGSEYAGGLVGKVGSKTSENKDGSNGRLTISASIASGVAVGSTSGSVVSSTLNEVLGEGEVGKLNPSSVVNGESCEVVLPSAGVELTRDLNGAIVFPAGTLVNGSTDAFPAGGMIDVEGGLTPFAESILLNKDELNLAVGESEKLLATVKPDGCSLVWAVDDGGIATVDENGLVVAVAAGETFVTVSCGDVFATCKVVVAEKSIPVKADAEVTDSKSLAKTGDSAGIVFAGLGVAALAAVGACAVARRRAE